MSSRMHCHEELLNDLETYRDNGFVTDDLLWQWTHDGYSTSRHLLTLYSMVIGLQAKTICEVGVGRSSFALLLAAKYNNGHVIMCDRYDYTDLFSDEEKKYLSYFNEQSDKFWDEAEVGLDFIFMDYLSTKKRDAMSCYKEIKKAYKKLKQGGMIAIHDVCEDKYNAGAGLDLFREKRDAEVLKIPYCYGLGLIRRTEASPYGKLNHKYEKKKDGCFCK